jgi:hypothetical protein
MMVRIALGIALLAGCVVGEEPEAVTSAEQFLKGKQGFLPNGILMPNAHGLATTVSTHGYIDLSNEFFQDLGTNGRRCVSCHLPTAGWSITPSQLQFVFDHSDGGLEDDPFGIAAAFRLVDGANRPDADVSTLDARRAAYSMLLTKGLIRVGIGVPANAEFTLVHVDDPYGYAKASELSLFRRPLPSTNLKFLSAVMWDGREVDKNRPGIHFALVQQANDATQGHGEQPVPLTEEQRESIVAFEMGLHSAQEANIGVGSLRIGGATGGAKAVIGQQFYIGINDNLGDFETGAPFTTNVFTLYNTWQTAKSSARRQIERGQRIFNTRTFTIAGVGGLNGATLCGAGGACATLPASFEGTCTTCHNTPNGGNHSTAVPLDIGLVEEGERTPDLPLYTLQCNDGTVRRVSDPGRALITGKCADIGKFKGPILRSLASRPPYFHNGSAATLSDAVDFYDRRFGMQLTAQERADLAAFLATL